jgi:polyisoprenoid-binding protein YceI
VAATSSSPSPSPSPAKSRWRRGIVIGVVAVVFLVIAVPFVYFTFIQGDPPPELSLSDVTATTGAGGSTGSSGEAPLAGTWTVGAGSTAGYRVEETLFGQSNTAAARTKEVTGTLTIEGTTVTKADISVDLASVTSTDAAGGRRDDQFRGRIMNTDQFPTATFTLTEPIDLAPVPKNGVGKKYSATGELTLHGTTKTVTIPINAKRVGNLIAIQGITDITFSDYGIDNPSGGPASVGDSGRLEFLVQMEPNS